MFDRNRDVHIVVTRTDGYMLTGCQVIDPQQGVVIDLDITGVEYEHDASTTPKAKLSLMGCRVFFKDAP